MFLPLFCLSRAIAALFQTAAAFLCLKWIGDLPPQVRSTHHWCYFPSLGKWFACSLNCGSSANEWNTSKSYGGTLISCELFSWSCAGYLGKGCCWKWFWWNGIHVNCVWRPRLAVTLRKLSPSRVAFLALGLRSANQLLVLFLNSPMPSYFMVLTCPPSPL